MAKTILSVEFDFPGSLIEYINFSSDRSLLDADIILFMPDIRDFEYVEYYQGKPLLEESDSFRLKESSDHWRTELQTAFDAGKTIFLFLIAPKKVFVQTGQKKFSGTGRSRVTTDIVDSYDNYQCFPTYLGPIRPAKGKVIIPNGNLGVLSTYWKDFQKFSFYEAYVDKNLKGTLLLTKTGQKTVGGVFSVSKGWLIILPAIELTGSKYVRGDNWTAEAKKVGYRLQQHIIAIDSSLRSGTIRTPPPDWIKEAEYQLPEASKIEADIEKIRTRIESLERSRAKLYEKLDRVSMANHLLYEQGRALENAILECLGLMAYSAHRYDDGDSEFDAVFESPEGRFLGEAEGKDKTAVNIDKLSQLERNIQEDFQRDNVNEYAKGVLFGNAYRLEKPEERKQFFTEKCVKGAQRAGIALVRTPDLFLILKYLRSNPGDDEFKRACRVAIKEAEGEIVQFPNLPGNGSGS